MNIRALETLARIRQVPSFSKTAELQKMTLSALSMQMKTLEAELGVEIFDRSSRPPRLTPLGRQVADQAVTVLREHDTLKSLAASDDPLMGNYQIGFIQSASVRILPDFLSIVGKEAPFARFQISSGLSEHLSNQVETGQLDAAVVTRVHEPATSLKFDRIASEAMAIAVPDTHKFLEMKALSKALPFIHFMPSTGIGRLIAAALEDLPDQAERTITLDSIEATVECVKHGLGYTILPLPDVQRYADNRVHVRDAENAFPQREIVLATRSNAQTERWPNRLLEVVLQASGSLSNT